MSSTARERLFAKAEGRTKDVTLSTGDVVQVRPLKLTARTKLVKACSTESGEVDTEKLIPHLVIACTFDPATGQPIFTAGDFEAIEQLPAVEVDPLWGAAAELNGFSQEAVKDAKND